MAMLPSLFTPGAWFGPGDPFMNLHREMNRLFEEAMRGSPMTGGQGGGRTGMLLAPSMDVSETDSAVRIQAELPGVSEKDVELSLNEDVLTLRAEKKQERKEEREGVHVSERSYGTFQRSLRLPFQVDPDQVEARFENGVLTVTLPKSQKQERSRRIQVQGAQSSGGQLSGTQTGASKVGVSQPASETAAGRPDQATSPGMGDGSGLPAGSKPEGGDEAGSVAAGSV